MKLAEPTSAPKLHQPKLYPVVVAFAAVVTVATVALLFFLDKILEAVVQRGSGGAAETIVVLLTAAAGVFSLPYLLRMHVSPLMRIASCMALFTAVVGWILAAWWARLAVGTPYAASGLLAAYGALILAVVSVWVVGLEWPLKKRR
jgi:hypothetical protein